MADNNNHLNEIRAISRQARAQIKFLSMQPGRKKGWTTNYSADIQAHAIAGRTRSEMLLALILHPRSAPDYLNADASHTVGPVATLDVSSRRVPARLRVYRALQPYDHDGAVPVVPHEVLSQHSQRLLARCEVLDVRLRAWDVGLEVEAHPASVVAVYLPYEACAVHPVWIRFFRADDVVGDGDRLNPVQIGWFPVPGPRRNEDGEVVEEEDDDDDDDEDVEMTNQE